MQHATAGKPCDKCSQDNSNQSLPSHREILEPVGTLGVRLVLPLRRPREVVGSIGSSLAAVICGGDSGVNATDALSDALDLRGNGMRHGNRRDKLVQHQALEAAGLRFARTVSGTTWEEAGENVVLGPLHDVI